MVKRPLTDDEKTLSVKALNKYKEGRRRLSVKLRELNSMISEGLFNNYLEKLDELKGKKRGVCEELQEIDIKLVTLHSQITDGVEIKEQNKKEK